MAPGSDEEFKSSVPDYMKEPGQWAQLADTAPGSVKPRRAGEGWGAHAGT